MGINDKISRRDALKRLGTIAAGALAVSSGLTTFSACDRTKSSASQERANSRF